MPEPRRHALATLAIGVAVVIAMLAFIPVIAGGPWWPLSVLLVAAALLTAATTRAAGLPSAAAALVGATTIPISAAVAVVVVDGAARPDQALAGVDAAVGAAFRQIYIDAIPATGTFELGLVMAMGAALVALAADFVTSGLRAPIAGVLVVVAVAIVPGKAFSTGTDGLLLVAVAAAALAIVAADRRGRGAAPRVGGLAAGGAVAVVVALAVQLVLPAPSAIDTSPVSGPLLGSSANPLLRLGQDLRRGARTPVLEYSSTNNSAVYLRLAVLEEFTGQTWSPNGADSRALGQGVAPLTAGQRATDAGATTTTTITPASAGAIGDRLPLPYPAVIVSGLSGGFRWEQRGLTLVRYDRDPIGPYSVRSAVVDTTAATLRAASVSVPAGDAASIALPSGVPRSITTTARAWTRTATTPYAEALAIQNRLRDGAFVYDEDTPAQEGYDGDGLDVIARFLQVKAGYCVHFASTMAVMARIVGIPARIVVGYQPGSVANAASTKHAVTSDDLHAWPELYFDGVGWVRFEPTPGRGAVPSYAPVPVSTTSPTGTPTPTASALPSQTPEASTAAAPTTSDPVRQTVRGVGTALLTAGLVVLVLALPGAVRRLIRRRRLRRLPVDGAQGAWRELLDTLLDLGVPVAAGRSPRGVEAALRDRTGPEQQEALGRLRAAWERQAYSRSSVPVAAEDVLAVIAALRARSTAGGRLLAAVAPRSLLGRLARPRLAFGWSPPGSGSRGTRRSPGRRPVGSPPGDPHDRHRDRRSRHLRRTDRAGRP